MDSGWMFLKKLLSRFSRLLPMLCLLVIIFTIGYIFGVIQISGFCNEKYEIIKSASSPSGVSKSIVTTLVVVVFSSPKYRDRRNSIRKTWLIRNASNKIIHFFVIGTASLQTQELQLLQNEENANHDLMLLPNVVDSYTSLSVKLLEGFKWVDEHIAYNFLLKVDDDSFVMLDKLYELALKKPQQKLYWGFFDGRARVKRVGKWAEKNWFLCDYYLPYAKGGGYVLTSDLIHYIGKNSNLLSKYKNEDVSLGVWLAPLTINRTHDLRFDTEYRSRGCDNSFIITHKQSIYMMEEKFRNLVATGNLCSSEFRNSLSYAYNWRVPPSKCCIRNISAFNQS